MGHEKKIVWTALRIHLTRLQEVRAPNVPRECPRVKRLDKQRKEVVRSALSILSALPEVRAPNVPLERQRMERLVNDVVPTALSIHLTLLPEVRVNRATQFRPLRIALAKQVAFANLAFSDQGIQKVTDLAIRAQKTITILMERNAVHAEKG